MRGRAGRYAGMMGAGAVLLACTISPRTPLYEPRSESKDDEAALPEEEDEDFQIPEAERVTNAGARNEPRAAEAEDGEAPSVQLGSATFWLGPRPPWAALEQMPETPSAASQASTRWRLQRTVHVGHGYLHHAAFVPGDQSVVTLSNQTGRLYHFDLAGKALGEIPLPGFREFDDAAFTPLVEIPGRAQLLITRPEGTGVLDLSSGRIDDLEDTPAGTDIAHASRPGLYGVSHRRTQPQSGTLVLQWLSGEVALRAECRERPDAWALSPSGRHLAISYYPSNHVEIIDLREQTLTSTVALPRWGSPVDISPDGKLMALGGEKLQIASFPSGKILAEDTAYDNNIDTVRFTPQGDLLLVSAYDGKARSYVLPEDLAGAKTLPRAQLLRHAGSANVYALGLSLDGRSLVTSSGDKTLKIWKR